MTEAPLLRPAAPGRAPSSPASVERPPWAPTRALGRAVFLTGVLLIAAVMLGRVDLVVLAAPFALGPAVSLCRRPRAELAVHLAVPDGTLAEGSEVGTAVALGNAGQSTYDLVVMRARLSRWLQVPDGDRPHVATVPGGTLAEVPFTATARRWGRPEFGPVAAQVVACDGLLTGRPVVAPAQKLTVYPLTEPFRADEAMPRAAGLVGGHRSRRPGEGGELAGVRVFAPGDRLRRIDWRVSLRARQLHVAATLSDRDAEVVLLLDVLTDAGASGGLGGAASVLDTTVRASAAIAEHYLDRGDRVSLVEYGQHARRLRAASGRRHYLAVLEWLLDTRVSDALYDPYEQVIGQHLVKPNALVVVLTPLVDPRSAQSLARLARTGRSVVAVDTLPAGLVVNRKGPWVDVAYRLWRLERENTIGQLREHGVPVVAWAGAGSLDLVLRDVARMAAGPKAVLR